MTTPGTTDRNDEQHYLLRLEHVADQHRALVAALAALVAQWRAESEREHRQGNERDHVRESQSYLYGCDQTHDRCAQELETILGAHQEGR